MRTLPKLNISTLIFILIFLAGIIGFALYINNSFDTNEAPQSHHLPQQKEVDLT